MNASSGQLPLRDIHLPDPVSWWPPAPGWWLLLLLAIVLPVLLLWLRKTLRRRPINRRAARELQNIIHAHEAHEDKIRLVRELSILLRRTAMSYMPRQQSASVTGRQWVEQLNRLSDNPAFDPELADILTTAPYRPHSDIDVDRLVEAANLWIQGLPRRIAS